MDVIKFNRPLELDDSADFRSSPRGLRNAHLYPDRVSVRANVLKGADISSTLGITGKPYLVTNEKILSALDNVTAGDFHNRNLICSDSVRGLVVYPQDFDGSNEIAEVPHVLTVSSAESGAQAGWVDSYDGWVGYVIIPFNKRGEAGAWQYYSFNYTAIEINRTTGYVSRKPTSDLEVTVSASTSYFEIYRTSEQIQDVGARSWSGRYYYMGRYQGDTEGQEDTGTITVTDDYTWYENGSESFHARVNDIENATVDDLIANGLLTTEEATLPADVLSYEINLHGARYTGASLNCAATDHAVSMTAPGIFRADTMMNHKGVMIYGNVTWQKMHPAVLGWIPETGNTIKAQLEYETGVGAVYGPVLTLTNCGRVLFAWQGETALRVYNASEELLYRLIPDALGRYTKADDDAKYTLTRTIDLVDPIDGHTEQDVIVEETINLLWSYDFSWSLTGGAGGGAAQIDDDFETEENVAMLSAQDRPTEVTTSQFYLPDNSPIRKIMSARLSEEESQTAYSGYAFTDKSVFHWQRNLREVTTDYVDHTIGLKYSTYTKGAAVLVRGGVCFVSTNNRLFFLSGRNPEPMDKKIRGLWTTLYDVAYHKKNFHLYILSDTGVWVYDFDLFGGIFKQIHLALNGSAIDNDQASIQYIEDTIDGVYYEGVMLHDGRTGEAYLLEGNSSGTVASDAYVESQWIRPATFNATKMELTVDHDTGLRGQKYSMTYTASTVTLTGSESGRFTANDVGEFIALQKAGADEANVVTQITAYTNPTTVTVATPCGNTSSVAGMQCIWPVSRVTHSVRGPEDESMTFLAYPHKKRFPKFSGFEHQLRFSGFKEFRESRIELREV